MKVETLVKHLGDFAPSCTITMIESGTGGVNISAAWLARTGQVIVAPGGTKVDDSIYRPRNASQKEGDEWISLGAGPLTVAQLKTRLRRFDEDSDVAIMPADEFADAPVKPLRFVYESKKGYIVLAADSEVVYDTDSRPVEAPSADEDPRDGDTWHTGLLRRA